MKKFLIFISLPIVAFLLFINFYQYLFIFEVNNKSINKLFDGCPKTIDVSKIPKTAVEWRKQYPKKESFYLIKWLDHNYEPRHKIIELAVSLGDIVDKNHDKSFLGSVFFNNPRSSYNVYYDYKGDLLFLEKVSNAHMIGICRYNNKGIFIEASYRNDELFYTFTPEKHLMYRCHLGNCEKDLIKYKKSN